MADLMSLSWTGGKTVKRGNRDAPIMGYRG
jgi:hypothetical protein